MTGRQERNWQHKYRKQLWPEKGMKEKMISKEIYKSRVLPELTDEQKLSPYAPIYYKKTSDPDEQVLKALGLIPIDDKMALDDKSIYLAFLPEAMPCDNGWCIRADGTGYSTVRIIMPGVTPEIEKWWYGWFKDPGFDYLNYKIWMPGWHKSHSSPLIEDVGWGYLKIYSDGFGTESMLNIDGSAVEMDPDFMHAVVSSGISIPEDDPEGEKIYNSIIKIYKKHGTGIQVQAFNYLGVRINEGRFEKMHDADPDKVRMFAWHNAYECHRMGQILPELYKIANMRK